MNKISRLLIVSLALFSIPYAHALTTPLAFSLMSPVQFPAEDMTVAGARLSLIYGKHRSVYGLDLGLIGNVSTLNFGGIQASGLFNLNRGVSTILGLQIAGITNMNVGKTRIVGIQLAGALNSNQAESKLIGFGIAALGNYSPFTKVYGAQIGLYNRAQDVYGFQIGLINSVDSLHGIQIGLLNFNKTGLFAVAPILNVGF